MNSIQHFINSHDYEQANAYLADFATLIRITLEDAQHAFIILNKEIYRIKTYLSLEQLRFGKGLHFNINISDHLQKEDIYLPNMILQPYIENAIWHGIKSKKRGLVDISISPIDTDRIKITIKDNGVGIDLSKTNTYLKKSYGMKLTKQRLELLELLLNQHYSINVTNIKHENQTGTVVDIIIPRKINFEMMHNLEEAFNN